LISEYFIELIVVTPFETTFNALRKGRASFVSTPRLTLVGYRALTMTLMTLEDTFFYFIWIGEEIITLSKFFRVVVETGVTPTYSSVSEIRQDIGA
jgi:hypothetical protein